MTYDTATSPSGVLHCFAPSLRNLVAAGLIADAYGLADDAAKVANAVEAAMVDPTQFRIFRAVAHGVAGDVERANAALADDIEGAPDDNGVRVGMAMALLLGGSDDWEQPVDHLLATSADQDVRAAARAVIDYARNLR